MMRKRRLELENSVVKEMREKANGGMGYCLSIRVRFYTRSLKRAMLQVR